MTKTLYGSETNNTCAYCSKHRVHLTYHQVRQKECLKKQCWHLQKNEKHPVWEQREIVKQKRAQRKHDLLNKIDSSIL